MLSGCRKSPLDVSNSLKVRPLKTDGGIAMENETSELEMACRNFGYGRWDAPYWFIGPEQGKGNAEPDTNSQRVKVWNELGKTELCDCLEFHARIPDMSWHGRMPTLQRTWRPLILLLKTFLDQPSDSESLRAYQRDRWGRVKEGETCVIELSGLAARSQRVPVDRKRFRQERIGIIRQRMVNLKTLICRHVWSE